VKRLFGIILIAGACGGVGAGGPCPNAGAVTCSKACACRTDGKCAVLVPSAGGTSTLVLNSAGDCQTEYQLACGNSPAVQTVDFNACQAGLQSAACATDPNNPGLEGLALPSACAPLW
jgi:hypothetical protein